MDILNPPKSYIDYRCFTYGLSGVEFLDAQKKFYKKNPDAKGQITNFFNWLEEKRNDFLLPYEKIEIKESDGKKYGHVVSMMIYDIEYWIEKGEMKQRKVYLAKQGQLYHRGTPKRMHNGKLAASGEREPGEEG